MTSMDLGDLHDQTVIRHETITDQQFIWPKGDDGAWDGPLKDWFESHRRVYFSWVAQRKVVVTAGACAGMYARWYGNTFDWVYAFEPEPLNFYCLVRNAPQSNVFKFNCALGEKGATAAINIHDRSNVGCHTINDKVAGAVPIIALDSLGLNRVDLLQLDAEGYEPKILDGAFETIQRTQPIIVVERGPGYEAARLMLYEDFDYEEKEVSASDVLYAPRGYERPVAAEPLLIFTD